MTEDDKKELRRLSDMLQEIDRQLGSASPMREALMKAGIALSLALCKARGLKLSSSTSGCKTWGSTEHEHDVPLHTAATPG